jgi:hypothetical protein
MLDLQPRVHFHEEEPVRPKPVGDIGDELHRARAAIIDGACRPHGSLAHRPAHLRRHARRRRFLDHLLVAPLQRAVPLEQMHGIAMPVAKHLDFDMARLHQVFFDQHRAVAEGRLSLPPRRLKRCAEILRPVDAAHALAATARPRLDQHRKADGDSPFGQKRSILVVAMIARNHRYPGLLHQRLCRILQAHSANGAAEGPMKAIPAASTASAKSAFSDRNP